MSSSRVGPKGRIEGRTTAAVLSKTDTAYYRWLFFAAGALETREGYRRATALDDAAADAAESR